MINIKTPDYKKKVKLTIAYQNKTNITEKEAIKIIRIHAKCMGLEIIIYPSKDKLKTRTSSSNGLTIFNKIRLATKGLTDRQILSCLIHEIGHECNNVLIPFVRFRKTIGDLISKEEGAWYFGTIMVNNLPLKNKEEFLDYYLRFAQHQLILAKKYHKLDRGNMDANYKRKTIFNDKLIMKRRKLK